MNGDNGGSLEKICGDGCVLRIHGEVATDGQNRVIKGIQLGQQLHIAEESSITGKIELGAIKINYKATGVPTSDAGAMEGQCYAHLAKGEHIGTTEVHAVGLAAGFACHTGDFCSGNNGSITFFGNFKGAA